MSSIVAGDMARRRLMATTIKSKQQVDKIFADTGIDDFVDRIIVLRQCMKVIDSDNIGKATSNEDAYNDEAEFFVHGPWRMLVS